MSYDVYLEVDAGGDEPVEAYWANYTSNCAPMWLRAMPDTDGLAGMDGIPAQVAGAYLEAGILRMETEPDEYRALNPSNGWGDFEGQLEFLQRLAVMCRKFPLAKVRISR
jgi:hypothetical protein